MEIILIISIFIFVGVTVGIVIFLWRRHKIIKTVLDFDSKDVFNFVLFYLFLRLRICKKDWRQLELKKK